MNKAIGFPDQLTFKERIDEIGLKKGFISQKIGVNQALFSLYINGRMYMPEGDQQKLNEFLNKYE